MAKLFSKNFVTKNATFVAKEASAVRKTDVAVGLSSLPAEIRVLVYRELIREAGIEHSAGLEPYDEDRERPSLNSTAESNWIETPTYHTASTGQTTKASSKKTILNLCLTHPLIKHELDHEIIVSTTSHIQHFTNTLTNPLGYSSSLQDTALDPSGPLIPSSRSPYLPNPSLKSNTSTSRPTYPTPTSPASWATGSSTFSTPYRRSFVT
jgi:hypothetical protein